MSHARWMVTAALLAAFPLAQTNLAGAGTKEDKEAALKLRLANFKTFYDKMPSKYRLRLSGAALNLAARSGAWTDLQSFFEVIHEPGEEAGAKALSPMGRLGPVALPLSAGRVSDPKQDLQYSNLAAFTQSETSSAWCGSNVVVGFNDSGSLGTTFPSQTLGLSFVGYSRSTNKGSRFTDLGALNTPLFFDSLEGDPVVACTDVNTFYFASLYASFPADSAISVSKSANGGASFGDPVLVSSKSQLAGHFLDKEWMAVDPTNANNIYVTYTDFDSSGSICGTASSNPIFRTGIELVKSTDGGGTWSVTPLQVTDATNSCDTAGNQGSQVVVDGSGNVYVAYAHFTALGQEIDIVKSTNGGATFSPPVKVDDTDPSGFFSASIPLSDLLQGQVRTNEFPSLTVDRSGIAGKNGNVYLSWQTGDLLAPFEAYGDYIFSDIAFSRSTDGGATWSPAVRVNKNVEPFTTGPFTGSGTDQFEPGLAVDRTGALAICYYSREADPSNARTFRYCAKSTTLGAAWSPVKKATVGFSLTGQDSFLNPTYMGDYDSVASDFTKSSTGFIGAYGDNTLGNPDVKSNKP